MATSSNSEEPTTSENTEEPLEFGSWTQLILNYRSIENDWTQTFNTKKLTMSEDFFELLCKPQEIPEIKDARDKIQGTLERLWDKIEKLKLRGIRFHLEILKEHISFLTENELPECLESPELKELVLKELVEISSRFQDLFNFFPDFSDSDFAEIDKEMDEKLEKMLANSDCSDYFKGDLMEYNKYRTLTVNWKKVISEIQETGEKLQLAGTAFDEISKNRIDSLENVLGARELEENQPGTDDPKAEFLKISERILKLDLLENHKSIDNLVIHRVELLCEKIMTELLILKHFPSRPSNSPEAVVYENMIRDFMLENQIV